MNLSEHMMCPGPSPAKEAAHTRSGQPADPSLMKACAAMEAQFINYLFKEMRETIPEGGFIPRSTGEKIYTSMLDAHLAEELSQSKGIGLAPILYDQLAKLADPASGEEKNSEFAKVFPLTRR